MGAAVPACRPHPAAAPGAERPGPDRLSAFRWSAFRLSAFLILVLPGVWCAVVLGLEFVVPRQIQLAPLLAAAPAIACAGTGRRQCVLLAGVCAGLALVPAHSADGDVAASAAGFGARVGTFSAILSVVAVSALIAHRRRRVLGELRRAEEIAEIAQRVVLRPPASEVGGLQVAARYISATRGAAIGGDFYEVVDTDYGVRAVVGDVRGHGLAAVECAAVLLGAFREAAYDEPDLAAVVRRLDRSLCRHLAEPAAEEFVSLVALSADRAGHLDVVNRGHPSPYLLRHGTGTVSAVDPDVPALPLGLGGLVEHGRFEDGRFKDGRFKDDDRAGGEAEPRGAAAVDLEPGDSVLLYTDGVTEARDGGGEFFPLGEFLLSLRPDVVPEGVVGAVTEGVAAHCGGSRSDDLALLLVRWPVV